MLFLGSALALGASLAEVLDLHLHSVPMKAVTKILDHVMGGKEAFQAMDMGEVHCYVNL